MQVKFKKPICLIGFMGSGKTTLGKKLAKRLNLRFIDSDTSIEELVGLSVMDIFEKFGEAHFRTLESSFLADIDFQNPAVIAAGGGLPCSNNNLFILLNSCYVFYLQRSPRELLARVRQGNQTRPLLKNLEDIELEEYIERTLRERESFYAKAHFILSREDQNVDSILEILQNNLE